MSFWDLSDGQQANQNVEKEYEVPGGNMDPLPNNSDVLAEIKEAKWDSAKDAEEKYISIQWQVQEPAQYKNRVIFQKLWVAHLDPNAKSEDKAKAKRDKARKMLATIDANAKGRLMQSTDAPTDDSLALALQGAQMVIKAMVWEMPDRERYGEFIRGNWISAVKPKGSELHIGEDKPKPSGGGAGAGAGGQPSGGGFDLGGDDIPFAPEWRV